MNSSENDERCGQSRYGGNDEFSIGGLEKEIIIPENNSEESRNAIQTGIMIYQISTR